MKRRITVASAKDKARWVQNWVCRQVSKLSGLPWGYGDDRLIQPRVMGQKGVDVILRGAAAEKFKFSVECKSSESWSVPAAIRQARRNKKENTDWLLVMKRKEFMNPVVILDGYVFFDLLRQIVRKNS